MPSALHLTCELVHQATFILTLVLQGDNSQTNFESSIFAMMLITGSIQLTLQGVEEFERRVVELRTMRLKSFGLSKTTFISTLVQVRRDPFRIRGDGTQMHAQLWRSQQTRSKLTTHLTPSWQVCHEAVIEHKLKELFN